MKYVITFIILLQSSKLCSQFKLEGIVKDYDTKAELANVNIYNSTFTIGTYTDVAGRFIIETNKIDSFIFSMIGYESRKVLLSEFKRNAVELKKEIKKEEIVTVTPKIFINDYNIGNIKKSARVSVTPLIENEIFGILLKEEKQDRNLYISSLSIQFDSDKFRESQQLFRIHIYSLDDSSNLVENLLSESFFYQLPKKQLKTVNIDLNKLNIAYPNFGVFIGIENLTPIKYSSLYNRGLLLSLRKQKELFRESIYLKLNVNRFLRNRGVEPQFSIKLKEYQK